MTYHIWGTKKDHRLYSPWRSMIKRCYHPGRKDYKWYGGRGITVCVSWHDFWTFVKDMDDSFLPGLTLDRIDVNGNYEPSNCRWATWDQQLHNQRKASITKRSSTGIAGINRAGTGFVVRQNINGVRITLGKTTTLAEAKELLNAASHME